MVKKTEGKFKKREGMATKQGAVHNLKAKLKSQEKALKKAQAEHQLTDDSVSRKAVESLREKINNTKDSIISFQMKPTGKSSTVKGLRKLSIAGDYDFKSGGLVQKSKMTKGGSYKGKQHNYATGGLVKELKI